MEINRFKTDIARNVFKNKYAQGPNDTWDALCDRLVEDVCGSRWGTDRPLMSDGDRKQLAQYMKEFKFVAGGRYLYYAGRTAKFYNNCFGGETKVLLFSNSLIYELNYLNEKKSFATSIAPSNMGFKVLQFEVERYLKSRFNCTNNIYELLMVSKGTHTTKAYYIQSLSIN